MKYCASVLLCFALSFSVRAEDFSSCFVPGEISGYKVSWMGIPLAWSKSTTDTTNENGRELIRIRMVTQTYAAYSHIYKVDDITEVLIDPKTALPVRLDIILNEGSRKKSNETHFDHENRTAVYIDRLADTTNTVEIAADTREVMSFLYSMRQTDIADLTANVHTLFVDGKLHKMGVGFLKEKKAKLPTYGKVECSVLEPVAEFDALFLREGKIFFWVSKADRRMVTLVQAKVAVGKINVKLQKVSGPGDDFWVKEKEQE
ncbi:DUF3108 domain-containing protein [Pontiella agarivorans]|uniref:DUF3108 domain-containing protein n=1 Tax=Pontiella agarivorans TaxID=3038953 RepID=A0ABU5N185_9BACT|nr:DUF3108 domain-containing protein [Pontiella agarivorans]MDZ8120224.1 DUF3108 domain-containing protein [Pontiella agarivorans]